MKINKKIIFVLFQTSIFIAACEKFVDIPKPGTQVLTAEVFRNNETATSVVHGIYGEMIINGASSYYTALLTGLSGDEIDYPSNDDEYGYFMNAINPDNNAYGMDYWASAYSYIVRANAIFNGCSESQTLHPDVKRQLMGEALFIRAYWYFYLVNLYGKVPLALGTDYKVNMVLSRASENEVYEQIINDLKAAQDYLSTDYVSSNSLTPAEDRIRPNRACATALLARVYLYRDRFTEAEELANSLIDNAVYVIEPLERVFLRSSKEAIWHMAQPTPNLTNINVVEPSKFILLYAPSVSHQTALNTELINAFEAGDQRMIHWIGNYIDSTSSHPIVYYFPYKYKVREGSNPKEYTMIFRLSEQYLIRAEARARLGRYPEALSDLNVIRKRAGLPLLNADDTQLTEANLLKLIMRERQVELFTEQGHRWLDLKRSHNLELIMAKVSAQKNTTWKPGMELWPLPTSEILNNSHLDQNPGYN
jgi:hypothetical protein